MKLFWILYILLFTLHSDVVASENSPESLATQFQLNNHSEVCGVAALLKELRIDNDECHIDADIIPSPDIAPAVQILIQSPYAQSDRGQKTIRDLLKQFIEQNKIPLNISNHAHRGQAFTCSTQTEIIHWFLTAKMLSKEFNELKKTQNPHQYLHELLKKSLHANHLHKDDQSSYISGWMIDGMQPLVSIRPVGRILKTTYLLASQSSNGINNQDFINAINDVTSSLKIFSNNKFLISTHNFEYLVTVSPSESNILLWNQFPKQGYIENFEINTDGSWSIWYPKSWLHESHKTYYFHGNKGLSTSENRYVSYSTKSIAIRSLLIFLLLIIPHRLLNGQFPPRLVSLIHLFSTGI